jgi:hypothetical protein
MGRSMRKKIMSLDLYDETKNLSRVIMKILTLLIPVIEREHKWGEQRMSRYMYVSVDPEEKRDHVHAYLPPAMYRRLKLMHQDLNFYSIAQIIRGFLEFFLDLVEEYGKDVFKELKRLFKKWEGENKKNRLTPRKILRQLGIILLHLKGQKKLVNVYDAYFTPFWIFQA